MDVHDKLYQLVFFGGLHPRGAEFIRANTQADYNATLCYNNNNLIKSYAENPGNEDLWRELNDHVLISLDTDEFEVQVIKSMEMLCLKRTGFGENCAWVLPSLPLVFERMNEMELLTAIQGELNVTVVINTLLWMSEQVGS